MGSHPELSTAIPSPPSSIGLASPIIVPIGSDLADIALDPIRPVAYVADRPNNRVLAIGLDNGTILHELPTEAWPFALAIDPSGSTLYVGYAANRSILAVNLTTFTRAREIPTEFLTAALAAPTNDTLVATIHDFGWSYPYVVNATDGTIIQRLGLANNQNFPTFHDSLVALSGDRTRLFLADTQVYPTTMKAFVRAPGARTWTLTAVSPGGGDLGDVGRDLAVSPDGRFVYLATLSNSVLRVDATTLGYAGTIGPYTISTAVVVSASGSRIALSAYDREAHVFDAGGLGLGNFTFSARVDRMRVTADGTRLVATVGAGAQDVEILLATSASPIRPVGLTRSIPDVEVRVVTFEDHRNFQATMELDGGPVNASYDVSSGILYWTPIRPILEGDHTVTAHVWRYGVEVARVTWPFTLDVTPPAITLDTVPPRTDTSSVVVRGTVADAHLASFTVDGAATAFDAAGAFSTQVSLQTGQNRILLVATDAVGLTTTRRVDVYYDLARYPYVIDSAHFGIGVPDGWHILANADGSDPRTVLLLTSVDEAAAIRIADTPRALQGTTDEARAILQDELDAAVASAGGFTVLEPIHAQTVDGHPAAGVFGTTRSAAGTVYETLLVVLAPEWGSAFLLSGTVMAAESASMSPYVNATLATFDVLPGPARGLFETLQDLAPAVLLIAGVGVVGLTLVVFRRRRRRVVR